MPIVKGRMVVTDFTMPSSRWASLLESVRATSAVKNQVTAKMIPVRSPEEDEAFRKLLQRTTL